MASELPTVCLISLILLIGCITHSVAIKLIILMTYLLFNIILAATLVSIHQFGIYLSIKTVKLAIINRQTLSTPNTNALKLLSKTNSFDLITYPIIYLIAYVGILFNTAYSAFFYTLAITYSLFLACKVRTSRWYNLAILPIVALLISSVSQQLTPNYYLDNSYVLYAIVTIFMATPMLFKWLNCYIDSPILSQRCCITRLFLDKNIKIQDSIEIKSSDAEIVAINTNTPKKSMYFATCKDANIILITLESVSAAYSQSKYPKHMKLNYFDQLAEKSWASNYHICISPNTSTSYHTLYLGQYFNSGVPDYISELNINNYNTCYVDTGISGEYTSMLEFKNQFENENLEKNIVKSETDSLHLLIDKLEQNLNNNQKLFLHIKNDQTHYPYSVYESNPLEDPYERYLQSSIEADNNMFSIIERLRNVIDMENTIIVYTADHGQSFGEMGYFTHSTSITNSQLHVPFLINHPKLNKRQINFSSHFDIFPTLFDLIGIESPEQRIGSTLGLDKVDFSHTVFSELRSGRVPACYGHINKERKIFIDAAQSIIYMLDHEDNIINHLSKDEKKYYQQVMLRSLNQRGLIDRSLHVAKWL